MPTNEDLLFGSVVLKQRLVDADTLSACSALVDGKSLGEVLLAKGYITANAYDAIAAEVRTLIRAKRGGDVHRTTPAGMQPPATGVHASEVEAADYGHLAGQPLDAYLVEARRLGASDLHFQSGARPYVRLHGEIVYLRHPILRPDETELIIQELLSDEQLWFFEQHSDFGFCYESEHGRYRASLLRQRRGVDAVFRVIPQRVNTIADLHLPEALLKFTDFRQGLILIAGPASSGKTATAAALLDVINQARYDHIVTIEDPVEYVISSKRCNVSQRSVGTHTRSYASALRSAMRSDPDYLFIGEMRDLETTRIAITAAETGHLVFATLHTASAVRCIDRMIDIFPDREQEQMRAMVSESLRGVIAQQLLPRADGRGRAPAVEVMFATPAAAKLIRERKSHQLASVLQTGAKEGMITMDDSIGQLLARGLITRSTADSFAEGRDPFARRG